MFFIYKENTIVGEIELRIALISLALCILLSSSTSSTILVQTLDASQQITEEPVSERIFLRVDKRIELIMAALILSKWKDYPIIVLHENRHRGGYTYKQDMLEAFLPFKDHELVTLINNQLHSPIGLMLHFSEPPDLTLNVPFPHQWANIIGNTSLRDFEEEFAQALRDFYLVSGFEGFWDSHEDFYSEVEERANSIPLEDIVETLEDYFGMKKEGYYLVLAPVFGAAFSAPLEVDNSLLAYAVLGPRAVVNDMPNFQDNWGGRMVIHHEFIHSFTSPLIDEFSDDFKNPERLIEPIYKDFSEIYEIHGDSWIIGNIEENICIAIEHMLTDGRSVETEENEGHIFVRPLISLLSKYDREKYPSFREFYPEIVDMFNAIAREHSLKLNIVDEEGQEMPNVTVTLRSPTSIEMMSKLTDNAGTVVFEDIINITYPVEATENYKSDFLKSFYTIPRQPTITLGSDKHEETMVMLDPMRKRFPFTVRVVNATGEVLPDVNVTLFWPNGKQRASAKTDNAGEAVFYSLTNITYTIEASLEGYTTQTREVEMTSVLQTETLILQGEAVPFIETPLGIGIVLGGILLTATTVLLILRRRSIDRQTEMV